MLSQAAARPPGAAPAQGLLGGAAGGVGGDGGGLLSGFARSGSSGGQGQPPPTQLQPQQELLGGFPMPGGPSGPSPSASLSTTPRTLSSGLAAGALQPGGEASLMGAAGGGGKGWSSQDGIPRPNWQQLAGAPGAAGNPSNSILGAGIPRPPSTGPSNPLGGMQGLSQSFEGSLGRGTSPNPLQGLQGGLPAHLQQQQRGATPQGFQGLPNGLPSGNTTTQQQLLQQHLAAQRAQAGLAPGGFAAQQQQQQQQAASLANLQAAAQAAQAAQAAAIRQQALLRNVQLQALQAQQNQAALQQAQQQQLLNQALRANGLQAAGLGQRPPTQLQSEALIAMQRQQAALQAQGLRMPQAGGGVAGTGLSTEQLLQLQQLGLLNKPAAPVAPPAAPSGSMTAQQQAALLSALQAGGQHKGLTPNLGASLQLQQRGGPPGLANGAAFLGQAQQAAAVQQLQRGPTPQQQQQQQQQLQQANLLAALGAQRPPLPPQQVAHPPAAVGALAGLGGRPGGGDGQSDPIQTLQDIGKTLAQLNITVEAAVNAGLLGGLSASDVKIVAEAHRAEMDTARAGTPGAQAGGMSPAMPIGLPGSVPSAPGSMGAPTPPAPASPAHSHASAAAAALGPAGAAAAVARAASARAASEQNSTVGGDDDDFPLDAEEESAPKQTIDEAALRAKVEQMAAQFDASQYGFFGAGGAGAEGELLGEIETKAPAAAAAAGNAPPRPKSDPGAEGEGEGYHLWGGASLPDELDSKLNLGGDPHAGGRGSAPPSVIVGSAPAEGAGMAAAAAAAQQQQQQQQPAADLASLWGNAQGDRNDPFGSYLAGLRLGTGF
ncbi:hypothetical protein ABPG75_009691 [Micractinium tetrahymenae]